MSSKRKSFLHFQYNANERVIASDAQSALLLESYLRHARALRIDCWSLEVTDIHNRVIISNTGLIEAFDKNIQSDYWIFVSGKN